MVLFHADDYGINPRQAERILACSSGCLRSVSIMPNSPYLQQCIKQLNGLNKGLLCAVHINLAEGPCCADQREIPLLVDQQGQFKLSFGKLLLVSFFRSKAYRQQIKKECMAQILAVCKWMPVKDKEFRLRLDSHVHYHMIPVVFRALCDACAQLGVEVEAVRLPVEPLWSMLQDWRVWRSVPVKNMVKNIVLHLCAAVNYPALLKAGWKDKTAVFFGIRFTGNMNQSVLEKLVPHFAAYAAKKGKDLEVLLHPGWILEGEYLLDQKYAAFHQSQNRRVEHQALRKFGTSSTQEIKKSSTQEIKKSSTQEIKKSSTQEIEKARA